MYCIKCGEELTEDALFCTECGYKVPKKREPKKESAKEQVVLEKPIEEVPIKEALKKEEKVKESIETESVVEQVPEPVVEQVPEQKQPAKKTGKILMIGIPILLLVIIGTAYFLFFSGRSEKKTIEQCVDALYQGDAKDVIELFPEPVVEMMLKEQYAGYSEKEMIRELQDDLDELRENMDWEFGRGWTYEYHIIEEYPADANDIETLQFGFMMNGYDDFKISEAKVVSIEVDFYNSYDSYCDTEYMDVQILKSGNSWYLYSYY